MPVPTRPHLPHAFAADPAAQWEADLFAAWVGHSEKARIGRIPHAVARALRAHTTIVYLGKAYAKKIRLKHEVTFPDLAQLPEAFQGPNVARDGRDIAFWFASPADPALTMKAVIKVTRQGHELWLKTMHPIAKSRMEALQKKAPLLFQAK